jgi:DNA-directed RNA polymerase subunit M/transcription elongation factor TFIIS
MIHVECSQCGTRLKGPDHAAGTRIRCPKCGYAIRVPEKVYEAEPIAEEFPPQVDPYADDESDSPYGLEGGDSPYGVTEPAEERRKPCPMCGEMIVASAAKCRFCGEILDPKLKKVKAKKSKSKKNYSSDDDDLSTTDIVLCMLCPGIGCIGGVIYMIQGKGKGVKALGISIVASVVWSFIRYAMNQGQDGP